MVVDVPLHMMRGCSDCRAHGTVYYNYVHDAENSSKQAVGSRRSSLLHSSCNIFLDSCRTLQTKTQSSSLVDDDVGGLTGSWCAG